VHTGLHRCLVQHLLEVAGEQQAGSEKGDGEYQHRHIGLGEHTVAEQSQIYQRVIRTAQSVYDERGHQCQADDGRYQDVAIGNGPAARDRRQREQERCQAGREQ
jgi:hypothetical protein